MTTAAKYRQFARECIDSARDATSEPVRHQFLEIAKLWLTAAARMDAKVVGPEQTSSKVDSNARANLGGQELLKEHDMADDLTNRAPGTAHSSAQLKNTRFATGQKS